MRKPFPYRGVADYGSTATPTKNHPSIGDKLIATITTANAIAGAVVGLSQNLISPLEAIDLRDQLEEVYVMEQEEKRRKRDEEIEQAIRAANEVKISGSK